MHVQAAKELEQHGWDDNDNDDAMYEQGQLMPLQATAAAPLSCQVGRLLASACEADSTHSTAFCKRSTSS